MKAFSELLGHLTASLDGETMTLQEAGTCAAEHIAARLACSRVSIWVLEGDAGRRAMRRLSGFDIADGPLADDTVLLGDDQFADYFDALTSKGVYVCHDTLGDARLQPMAASYLVPHDIHASLDATVGVNGSTWAVLCCAQRGAPRQWTPQETRLVKGFADAISVRRARRRRREAEAASLMQRLLHTHQLPTDEPAP